MEVERANTLISRVLISIRAAHFGHASAWLLVERFEVWDPPTSIAGRPAGGTAKWTPLWNGSWIRHAGVSSRESLKQGCGGRLWAKTKRCRRWWICTRCFAPG